ncbi:hypothetical protein ASE00_08950 [Sphingomonas sp. Root710]|nr:hypothetical protein ASE00_08950 [Sphingomonas sp. Root710]
MDLGYSVHGAGTGKPSLIFVHGGLMSSTSGIYAPLIDLLARRYAVYALDLRGHGASAAAYRDWTLNGLADDVVAFARALGLDRPAYVGHSLGGFTGLLAAIRHPGFFSALCLLAPGPADPRSDPVEALEFLIAHKHERDLMRAGFSHMFVRPPGDEIELIVDAIGAIDIGVLRALQEENSRTSIDDRLGEIAAPVLLLCGERDTVVPPARQHDMARKLRRCKEVVFSSEGHMLPNEAVAMTAREVIAFLDHDRDVLALADLQEKK